MYTELTIAGKTYAINYAAEKITDPYGNNKRFSIEITDVEPKIDCRKRHHLENFLECFIDDLKEENIYDD